VKNNKVLINIRESNSKKKERVETLHSQKKIGAKLWGSRMRKGNNSDKLKRLNRQRNQSVVDFNIYY